MSGTSIIAQIFVPLKGVVLFTITETDRYKNQQSIVFKSEYCELMMIHRTSLA